MTRPNDLKKEAQTQTADLARKAQDAVHEKVDAEATRLRDTAAGRADTAADAAHAAADEFDPSSVQAEAMRHVADRIDAVAQKMRSTDIEEVARQTSDFARRNPLLFIGGAVALGFAATRFLKSSAPSHARSDPWAHDGYTGVLSELNEERGHA